MGVTFYGKWKKKDKKKDKIKEVRLHVQVKLILDHNGKTFNFQFTYVYKIDIYSS